MKAITDEIRRSLDAGLYYLAVTISLSLPDICAALESSDGEASGLKYKTWYEVWMAHLYPEITGTDIYSLRCGVIHQGRLGHSRMQYGRVIFTIPGKNTFHRNIIKDALNLDAGIFCRDLIKSAEAWYSAKQNDPDVIANIPRLVQFRENGMAPYMSGVPLIA